MASDILVVDDDTTLLGELRDLFQADLGIEPFTAASAAEALNIMKTSTIKVLVTDQVMPGMLGTELIKQVKSRQRVPPKCVLLTSQPGQVQRDELVRLGLFRYVDKGGPADDLSATIRDAIRAYDQDQARSARVDLNIELNRRERVVAFRPRVTTRITGISSIVEGYIPPDGWKTAFAADRNVRTTITQTYKQHVAISLDNTLDAEILSKAGVSLGKVVAELSVAAESRLKTSITLKRSYELAAELEVKREVEPISDAMLENGLTLSAREFMFAPVYNRINFVVSVDCTCCQIPRTYHMSVTIPTDELACRYRERFDDGSVREVDAGIRPASVRPMLSK